jgi:hypothetical protein
MNPDLEAKVTPTHHALGLFWARLFQGARKRQPVYASLRRAGAARLYERDIEEAKTAETELSTSSRGCSPTGATSRRISRGFASVSFLLFRGRGPLRVSKPAPLRIGRLVNS